MWIRRTRYASRGSCDRDGRLSYTHRSRPCFAGKDVRSGSRTCFETVYDAGIKPDDEAVLCRGGGYASDKEPKLTDLLPAQLLGHVAFRILVRNEQFVGAA